MLSAVEANSRESRGLVGLPQYHLSSRNLKNSFSKRKRNMKGWVMFCAVLAKTLVWESLLHADFLSFVHSIAKIPWSTGISNIKRIIGLKMFSVVISASKICDIYFQKKNFFSKKKLRDSWKIQRRVLPTWDLEMHHSGETLLISFHASSSNMGHYHLLAMIAILYMKICIAPWRANQKILCLFCFYQFYATLHEQTCR